MKKRRADLWEDTIIIAMRDMQWSNLIRELDREKVTDTEHQGAQSGSTSCVSAEDAESIEISAVRPPGFVKFDGNAEEKLSDVALKAGERFFLMEVKSTLSKVRTEWRREGGYSPKFMMERLSELVECAKSDQDAMNMLELSFRGHFATYWSGVALNQGFKGAVTSAPYITACVVARSEKDISKGHGMSIPIHSLPVLRDRLEPDSMAFGGISFYRLMRGRGIIQFQKNTKFVPIGLTHEEFLKYTAFLCGGSMKENGFVLASDSSVDARLSEPVHLVSLSNMGTHMKVMGSTAELATLLNGDFKPSPSGMASVTIRPQKRRI
ncbi:hypothetical protein LL974_04390 [Xanthomonas campestris pv. cannae]|nr:hypothetical protein [Xanthomonas campestris pv. cannae]